MACGSAAPRLRIAALEACARLSELLIEDIELILAGMPPVRLQRADPRAGSLGRSR